MVGKRVWKCTRLYPSLDPLQQQEQQQLHIVITPGPTER